MTTDMNKLYTEESAITTADHVYSKITIFGHKNDSSLPVMICMPAMGVLSKYYEPLAIEMQKKGWIAITTDLRGNGHSSVKVSKTTNFGYHEMITYDWPAIISKAREKFPNNPLFLIGHSLGGQLSTLYASINPNQVHGIVLIASGSVYFKGWNFPHNIGVLAGTQFASIISKLFGYFPGQKIGFAGTEAKQVMEDWAHNCLTGRYELSNQSQNFEELLSNLEIPVLAISFLGDGFAPGRAVKNLCRKMNRASVTYIQLKSDVTDTNKLNHFNWVKYSNPVLSKIDEWLSSLKKE